MKKARAKRLLKTALILFIIWLILVNVTLYLLSLPKVQTYLTQKAAALLTAATGAPASVKSVELRFRDFVLNEVLIRDLNSDTLLYVRQLHIRPALKGLLKKKIDVRSLRLEEAKVFLHRGAKDEEFNFENLFGKSESSNSSAENPFHIRMPKAEFIKLDFNYLDEKKHTQFRIGFERLFLNVFNMNPQEKLLSIGELELDGADILTRKLFSDVCEKPDEREQSGPNMLNTGDWHVLAGNIKIANSAYHNVNENNLRNKGGMNYNDLHVLDINLELDSTEIVCDTIHAIIRSLSAREKCGFSIKSMSAYATVSTTHTECKKLNLVTDNSVIKNYYSMSYESFSDFNDYVNRVTMHGDFTNARIALKDINYFAQNALEKIKHNTVWLSGTVKGPVSNLKGRGLKFSLGKETRFTGNISMNGLPVFSETFMTLEVKGLHTTLPDLKSLYPYISYPENFNRLGKVNFSGAFTGFPNDFVADGSLITDIGSISSDINLKLDKNNNAHYSGNFSAQNFHLGKYLENESLLGEITLSAKVKGSGLKLNTVKATVDGTVNNLVLKQHDYHDLIVNGELKNRFFKGLLTVRDENLDMDFEGTVDMTDTIPVFQFVSELRRANLKPLNLSKDNISVSSSVHLDFAGMNPEQFSGYAGIFNTVVVKDTEEFKLDTFELNAQAISKAEKAITLRSDIAEADVTGNFNQYKEIPAAILDVLRFYFNPSGTTRNAKSEQYFTFNIRLHDTQNLTKLLAGDFKNIAGGAITGSFDNRQNQLRLNALLYGVGYSNFELKNIQFNATSAGDTLHVTSSIDSVLMNDSSLVDNISLAANVNGQGMKFNLLAEDEANPTRLNLNGLLHTDFHSLALQFLPSSIHVNNDLWTIADSNKIQYGDNLLAIENLVFTNNSNRGELELKSFIDATAGNHLSVFFRDFDLHNVSKAFMQQSKIVLDGTINGSATVMNVLKKPMLTAALKVDTFTVNKHYVGDISVNSNYLADDDKVAVNISLTGASNNVKTTGFYHLKDKKSYLDFTCDIQNLHLPHVEPFIQKDVSKVQGDLSGRVTVKGTLDKPVVRGSVTAKNVAAKVNYLNTVFSFENEKILFAKNIIDLGEMTLLDEEGNTAHSQGILSYDNFQKLFLDIEVKTDNFLFMNSTRSSDQPFYGKLFAGGTVFIKGPTDNVEFSIIGTTKHGTNVFVDVNSASETDQYNFYRFINNNPQQKSAAKYHTKTQGITLNCDVSATDDAQVNLILDYDEGDIIKAQGLGDLKIILDKTGELSIVGDYKIVDGNYLFSMQNIISKKFSIERGSSINWSGDPGNATLDIKALYKLRASPYDLIEDIVTTDEQKAQAKDRVQVLLYLYISGSLLQPDIKFDIKVPDANASIRTALESRFQALLLDPNEFNKQVVGLLVLNRFLPQRTGTSEQPNIANDVNNSVSEFLSNQLSIYLSDWISEFITDVQLDINYRSYQSEVTGSEPDQVDFQNRQELQLALNKSFYHDRISVDVGGNFDFGQAAQNPDNGNASNIAGDFEIEYSITPDGRIKVKAFRKGEYDIFQNRNKNKTGIGISYEKEFDSFEDFFQDLRKKKEEKKLKKAAEDKSQAKPE